MLDKLPIKELLNEFRTDLENIFQLYIFESNNRKVRQLFKNQISLLLHENDVNFIKIVDSTNEYEIYEGDMVFKFTNELTNEEYFKRF